MKAISLRKMVIAIFIIGIGAGYVRAEKQQLQEKLSRDAKIQLNDVTIAEALKKIGETAEVKIVLSDEAVWKLPYGEATRLSVALTGPLADSLTEMLHAFFMRYAVGDEEITIYPRPELEHILGRPTREQIELLQKVYTLRLSFAGTSSTDEALTILLDGCNVLVLPFKHYRALESIADELLGRSPLPTFAQMLDSLGKWYLSGLDFPRTVTEIRIVDEEDFREARLDQVIDISFADSADVILQRLAGWAGMELFVEKRDLSWLVGVIAVNMQNVKLSQALRNIVSSVDGAIEIDFARNYIRIQGPLHTQSPPIHLQRPAVTRKTQGGGGAGEGYVGKVSIPMEGGKYFIEFMLRESDLTEELKKLREEKITEVIQKTASERKRKLIEALKKAKESAPTVPE